MLSWVVTAFTACWQQVQCCAWIGKTGKDFHDDLLWYKDLLQHVSGDSSMATVQANERMEDQSQIETGPTGTFVGIYDGHGGQDAALYVCDNLFTHVRTFAREQGGISEDVLQRAFQATEEGFLNFVLRTWQAKPKLATVGSCCLVGVIWRDALYVANLGDSRAVLGTLQRANGNIVATQLTAEHNAAIEEVRQELRALHPDDNQILVMKHDVWRIKGIIQVSRSIGDVYLKVPGLNTELLPAKFQLSETLTRPALTANPSVVSRTIGSQDRFLIFASDGLWEHLGNQQACEIVHKHSRAGIARRLITAALQEAAKKREMRYSDLKKIEKRVRRFFHDDITVVVVFLDRGLLSPRKSDTPISVRGGVDNTCKPSYLLSADSMDIAFESGT